jgi:hypothetical protein
MSKDQPEWERRYLRQQHGHVVLAVGLMKRCDLSVRQIAMLLGLPMGDVRWTLGKIISRWRKLRKGYQPGTAWLEMDAEPLGISGRTALKYWRIYHKTPMVPPSGRLLHYPVSGKLRCQPFLHDDYQMGAYYRRAGAYLNRWRLTYR